MESWSIFRGVSRKGHYGSGRGEDVTVYLRARDIFLARRRHGSLPSLKKGHGFTSLRALEESELEALKESSTGDLYDFLKNPSLEFYITLWER